jgi:hypothetical protein
MKKREISSELGENHSVYRRKNADTRNHLVEIAARKSNPPRLIAFQREKRWLELSDIDFPKQFPGLRA